MRVAQQPPWRPNPCGLAKGAILTGADLHQHLNTVDAPLFTLGAAELSPGAATLDAINAALR